MAAVSAFGSITDKELGNAVKLACACYKELPASGCKEETKFTKFFVPDPATTYFAFPGSNNAQDWQTNALTDMRPLKAWADRLPGLKGLPQLAHQVEPRIQQHLIYCIKPTKHSRQTMANFSSGSFKCMA